MSERFGIASIAKLYKISQRTLRFYEEAGLLDSHRRGSYREYDREQCRRLEIILLLRRLTFSIKEIAQLLQGGEGDLHAMLSAKIAASGRRLLEARETNRLLRDLAAEMQTKPLADISVAEMLATYVYLTKQTEGVTKMNDWANLGDYLVLIATDYAAELTNGGAGNLLDKLAIMRADLEKQGISFPMCRIRDDVNLAPYTVQIVWGGKLAWQKDFAGIDSEVSAAEIVEQIRQYALVNKCD